jgi:ADP-ribose pyrophosphatase
MAVPAPSSILGFVGNCLLWSDGAMHEVLFKNNRFSVERRTAVSPKGQSVTREIVVHPGAVVILPLLDAGRLIMVRNYRHTIQKELLELPAGTCEVDEDPIETASRELIEETGYRAGTMSPLACFYTSPGITTELMHAYIATDLTRVGQKLDPGEELVPEVCDLAKARRILATAAIEDAKTLAVLGIYFATQKA